MGNPYAGYGRSSSITGERFIGREREIAFLSERLSSFSGSISVAGEQRIGKTCLVREACRRVKAILDSSGIITLWVTASTTTASGTLYSMIMEEMRDQIAGRITDAALGTIFPPVPEDTSNSYQMYSALKKRLKNCVTLGLRTLLVIDEFDGIRNIEGARQMTQQFREFIDSDEYGLLCVFISRRSLYHLENQVIHISNLDGVCEKLYLKPLSRDETSKMAVKVANSWNLGQADIDRLYFYTGGHPFLTEMILCHVWDCGGSLEAGFDRCRAEVFAHYNRSTAILEEDGLFSILCQLTVGPCWQSDAEKTVRLEQYGLLIPNIACGQDGSQPLFRTYSDHFQLYLEMSVRKKPVWSLWGDTERALRQFVDDVMTTAEGSGWQGSASTRHSEISRIFSEAEQKKVREERLFVGARDASLLDFIYPMDLWTIIVAFWKHFQPHLKRDKRYWQERFEFVARMRPALAHCREFLLSEKQFHRLNEHCLELKEVIQQRNGVPA